MPLSEEFLSEFASRCLDALDAPMRDALAAAAAPPTLWGSGCSGTDSPTWAFRALHAALRSIGATSSFEHVFSAEHDWAKRLFLQEVASPQYLFSDVFDLSASRSEDLVSGGLVDPLGALAVDIFVAGFVCKSVSRLNNDAARAATAIWNEMTQTGSTLKAVILYCERLRPKVVILENVLGLTRNRQHIHICTRFRQLGYVAMVQVTSPALFGWPQDRPRLYFIIVRLDVLTQAGIATGEFERFVSDLHGRMASTQSEIAIDDVLYQEDHPFLVRKRAEEKRNKKEQERKEHAR